MKFLENKIPPPVLLIITLLLMYYLAPLESALQLNEGIRFVAAGTISIVALAIAIAATVHFRSAQTTVNPLKPESASQLVTSGVFEYTRNPMYLGMVMIAFAFAIALSSLIAILLTAGLIFYLDRLQIAPEERAMRNLFAAEFEEYCQRVRRWI